MIRLPDVVVRPDDFWMPISKPIKPMKRGARWDCTPAKEARLDRDAGFTPASIRTMLKEWWLSVPHGANTPNWDLRTGPFVVDDPGPLRTKQVGYRKLKQQIAERRRVEDRRVEEGGDPHVQ